MVELNIATDGVPGGDGGSASKRHSNVIGNMHLLRGQLSMDEVDDSGQRHRAVMVTQYTVLYT